MDIFNTPGTVRNMYKPILIQVTNVTSGMKSPPNSMLSPSEVRQIMELYPIRTEGFNITGGRNTYEIDITFAIRPTF